MRRRWKIWHNLLQALGFGDGTGPTKLRDALSAQRISQLLKVVVTAGSGRRVKMREEQDSMRA